MGSKKRKGERLTDKWEEVMKGLKEKKTGIVFKKGRKGLVNRLRRISNVCMLGFSGWGVVGALLSPAIIL